MATMKDVARLAGVSPATVSAVLRGTFKVSEGVRQKVLEVIEATNYRPNTVAQSLRTQRTFALGMIVPDISNPFYADIAQGVMVEARRNKYEVFVANCGDNSEQLLSVIRRFNDRRVEGLVIAAMMSDVRLPHPSAVPYVLVNRADAECRADFIGIDNVAAACDVVEHLWTLGHRRIGFVNGVTSSLASYGRLQGYLTTLQEKGIQPDLALIRDGGLRYEGGYQAAIELIQLKDPPSAIFAADDLMALGVMDSLQDQGYRIPQDISVIGFDGIWVTRLRGVQLSTVVQPRNKMGEVAVRTLLSRIAGEDSPRRHLYLPYELIWGKTTGPGPASERITS